MADSTESEGRAAVARLLRAFRFLYGALLLGVAALGLIVLLLARPPDDGERFIALDVAGFLLPFALIAAGITVAIPLLRMWLLRPRPPREPDTQEIADEEALAALVRCATVYLLSWALCEVIAILGVALSVLGRDISYFLAFGAWALLNFAFYVPRADLLRRHLRALLGRQSAEPGRAE